MKMISFEVDNKVLERLDRVSVMTGCSRSELCREGINEIIKHYSAEDADSNEDGQSVRDLVKKILYVLDQSRTN